MSQTNDEIEELYKRQALLMDHLGLEFEYDFDEPARVIKKRTEPKEIRYTGAEKKTRFIDFKEIDAKLKEMHTVDEVNEYEKEIMAMNLTESQKMAIRGKIIDRRSVLLYKERHELRR